MAAIALVESNQITDIGDSEAIRTLKEQLNRIIEAHNALEARVTTVEDGLGG